MLAVEIQKIEVALRRLREGRVSRSFEEKEVMKKDKVELEVILGRLEREASCLASARPDWIDVVEIRKRLLTIRLHLDDWA